MTVATPHSLRLDRIRDRENRLISHAALLRHDALCRHGSACSNREGHAMRDSSSQVRRDRIAELEAEISDLYVALAIVKRMSA